MRLQSLKVILSLLVAAFVAAGCGGGSPAAAPSGLKAEATESTLTISWDSTPGVEYWLFYAPTVYAPADNSNMSRWFGLPGGAVLLNVTSPYTLTGLSNVNSYSFTVNGRTGSGPGGPGATTVTASPRLAGSVWKAANAASAADLRGLTYVSSYLAVGTGGAVMSSTDGASWTAVASSTTNHLNAVSYFGNYKTVGDSGTVLTSADAVTWTVQNSGTTKNLYAVASNFSNLNVAVGAAGTIITSADGITWTAATASGTTRDLRAVIFNGSFWLAAGDGGTLLKSTDGLTWTTIESNTTADLRGLAYGSSTDANGTPAFVAVGSGGTVLSSADATTWTTQVLPGAMALNAVTYGTQFVVAGNAGTIFVGTNGKDFTAVTSGVTHDLLAVARGSLMYVATGSAGANLSSR